MMILITGFGGSDILGQFVKSIGRVIVGVDFRGVRKAFVMASKLRIDMDFHSDRSVRRGLRAPATVIASEAKQSIFGRPQDEFLRRSIACTDGAPIGSAYFSGKVPRSSAFTVRRA
jgi:hypothetical protein